LDASLQNVSQLLSTAATDVANGDRLPIHVFMYARAW